MSKQMIPTGHAELDNVTGGFVRGGLNVIASPVGMGKTTLMCDFAKRAAQNKLKSVIFTLEVPPVIIKDRLIGTNASGIDIKEFAPGTSVSTLRNFLASRKVRGGFIPDLVFVDSFDFLGPLPNDTVVDPHQRDIEKSAYLLKLALDYDCVVVATLQTKERYNLNDSNDVCNHAHINGLLVNSDLSLYLHKYERALDVWNPDEIHAKVVKSRRSPTGSVLTLYV